MGGAYKNMGVSQRGYFWAIPTLYPCNQLLVFEGRLINYYSRDALFI